MQPRASRHPISLCSLPLFLLAPVLAASGEPVVVREAAPLPARYATPFAVERDHPSLRTSELYRSYQRFPLHGYLQLRLCSGDPATLEGLLASLRTLPEREPGRPLYQGANWRHAAHDSLLRSCDTRDHCYWVLQGAESEPAHPGRDLLWHQFARCAMPSDAPRFESTKAPIDSLVRYYEGRRAPPSQYSRRLEAWVRQLVQTNQPGPLRAALLAYRNIDLPRTGETLIELASQAGSLEMRFAIGGALRDLSHPEARKLGGKIASEERAWQAELCQKRGLYCEIPGGELRESGPEAWTAPSFAPEPWELDPPDGDSRLFAAPACTRTKRAGSCATSSSFCDPSSTAWWSRSAGRPWTASRSRQARFPCRYS